MIGFTLLNGIFFCLGFVFFCCCCCNGSYWYTVNTVELESVFTNVATLSLVLALLVSDSEAFVLLSAHDRFEEHTLASERFPRAVFEAGNQ